MSDDLKNAIAILSLAIDLGFLASQWNTLTRWWQILLALIALLLAGWLAWKHRTPVWNGLNHRVPAWTNLVTVMLLIGVGVAIWLLGWIPARPGRDWTAARKVKPKETVTIIPTATPITKTTAMPTTELTAIPITQPLAIPTTEPTATPTALPPIAPSGPEVSKVSDYTIGLLWEDMSEGESGFRVERSTNGEDWQPVTTTMADVEAFTDTDLECETLYYYRIYAYRESDQLASEYSSIVEAMTQLCPWMYVVKERDDLYSLAQTFCGDKDKWADIFNRNRAIIGELQEGEDIPPIYPGQILLLPGLPPEISYKIQPGDELNDIALRFHGQDYGTTYLWLMTKRDNPDLEDLRRLPIDTSLTVCRLYPLRANQIIVRPGDSLDRIAEAYYGTTIKADAIYEANKDVIGEIPQKLQPWMILTLPDLPIPDTPEVESGETLSSIAEECYHDSTRWSDIQFTNRHILGDANTKPRIGQVLVLYGCGR